MVLSEKEDVNVGVVNPLVIIDPGHGGKDPGALAKNGESEKNITLAMAEEIALLLRARNIPVILTRTNDNYIAINDRNEFTRTTNATLFVSLHLNDTKENYVDVYANKTASSNNLQMATIIKDRLNNYDKITANIKTANSSVRRESACPALMIECNNIKDPKAVARYNSQQFCNEIANGIMQVLGIVDLEDLDPQSETNHPAALTN